MQKIKSFAVVIFFGITALGLTVEARAAMLLVDGGGQLTGATGVGVDGMLYDVFFPAGTCFDAFDGCDEVSDFDFQNEADATAAAQALLDQVFLDTIEGMFDSNPTDTRGCSNIHSCLISIPYQLSPLDPDHDVIIAAAENASMEIFDSTVSAYTVSHFDNDLPLETTLIYARFTPQVTVPEPGTIWLCGVGLAVLALVGWRHGHRPGRALAGHQERKHIAVEHVKTRLHNKTTTG